MKWLIENKDWLIGVVAIAIALFFEWFRSRDKVRDTLRKTVKVLKNEMPSSNVALVGIDDLHQIAIKHKKHRKKVHKQFCIYLRKWSVELYKGTDFEKISDKCPILQELIDCLFPPNNEDSIYKKYKSDLSSIALKKLNFENRKINNVIFINCDLEDCNFTNSTLTSCKFDNGKLNRCQFNEQEKFSIDFETMYEVAGGHPKGGILSHCTFCNATLSNCYFSEKRLFFCDFFNGNLSDCTFFDGDLSNCKFSGNLCDCKFNGAKLTVCNFENGKLYNCTFYSGALSSCCFEKTGLIDNCEFEKGRFFNCWFSYSRLIKCSFYDGTLTECRFGENIGESTILEKCNFSATNLFFCKTEYAKLIETEIPDNSFEYPKSLKEYKKTLKIGRKLPKENIITYLVRAAKIFYNTVNLNRYINKYPSDVKKHKATLKGYCELSENSLSAVTLQYMLNEFKKFGSKKFDIRVFEKREGLVEQCGKLLEEKLKNILAFVAANLNNLASLHRDANEYPNALKENEEALKIFRELAEENPTEYLTYVTMTLNDLANTLYKVGEKCYNQKNYNEAEKHYLRCLEISRELTKDNPTKYFPAIALFQYKLGLLYTKINEYPKVFEAYEEALKFFRNHVDDDPEYPKYLTAILYNLGLLYSNNKEYPKAFEAYKEATIINPNNDLYFLKWGDTLADFAKLNSDENIYRESFKKYEKATLINPKNYYAFNNWGVSLERLAKLKNDEKIYRESCEKYEKATLINADNYLAFSNLGGILLYLFAFNNDADLLTKALDVCQKAYELNKQKSYNLACCYARLEDKENALKYLEESLIIKDQTIEWILNDNDWKHYLKDEDFMNLLSKYRFEDE